jgi:hypothetical protein
MAYTLNQYRIVWKKRAANLEKAGETSASNAAAFMMNKAQEVAPFRSGALVMGIYRRRTGRGRWTVQSRTPLGASGYPYHKWVNHSPGYEQIRVNGRDPPVIYGRNPPGRSWKWTARADARVEGYWNLSRRLTRNYFREEAIRRVRAAIRV